MRAYRGIKVIFRMQTSEGDLYKLPVELIRRFKLML